jgi:hypothetical protein
MTPDEIKVLFATMREFRVAHFKQGDLDVAMDLDELPSLTVPERNPTEEKYWSAPEPEDEEPLPPTTT